MNNAPPDLGAAGLALWVDMHALIAQDDAEFDEKDVHLLTMACRQTDDIAAMQGALQADGVVVQGSQGQLVLNRIVTELRNSRESVARLLKQIDWPAEEKLTPSAAARKAASSRWANRVAPNRPTRRLPEAK